MNKYFDMNEVNKIVVNTLLCMKNNLSSALVFARDYKIRKLNEDCELEY